MSKSRAENSGTERHLAVVEIVGPAGAGKTTLLNVLRRRNPRISGGLVIPRIWYIPLYIRIAVLIFSFFLHGSWPGRRFTRPQARAMLYLMAWLRLLVRPSQNPHAVIALDHGPIFRLCEVCESSLGNEKNSSFQNWWKRMLHQWASTLDYIIWLDAPDSNLLERIQKRERWHSIKLQSKPEAFEFLIRSRACLKNVLGKMTVEGKAKVLYFDTSFQTTDQIARQILEAFDHTTVHPISQS